MATLLVPSPAQASYHGGDEFTLLGAGLTVASLQDTFSDGSIGAIWTTAVTGTGSIRELSGTPKGTVQLDTGLTANSTARFRSTDTGTKFDADFTITLPLISAPSSTQALRITLGGFTASTNNIRFVFEINKDGQLTTKRVSQANGGPVQTTLLSTGVLRQGTTINLRILSSSTTVGCYLNGTRVDLATWACTAARFELGVENDVSVASRLIATIKTFARRPVILFGALPSEQLTYVRTTRVDGITPPAEKDSTVNIIITDSAGTTTITNGLAYIDDPKPIVLAQNAIASVSTFSDITIKSL